MASQSEMHKNVYPCPKQDTERATPSQDSGSNAEEGIARSKLGGLWEALAEEVWGWL